MLKYAHATAIDLNVSDNAACWFVSHYHSDLFEFGTITCRHLPTYLSIYLSLSISLSLYLSISLSGYLSICLSVYLSVYLSIYLTIYLSICLSIYISTDLCIYLPINLSIPLPIYLPISIYLSTDLRLQLSVNEARSCPGRCLTTWAARRGPQWVMQDNCKLLFNQCGHWAHGSRQTVDCQCPCSIHRLTAWYARPGNITHGVGRKTTLPLQNFAIGTPNALVS
jgi:hypothetical protein